jgi:NAD(P)-dependent dehydrogenase (short-subunit alcohol dehydrogenase family)
MGMLGILPTRALGDGMFTHRTMAEDSTRCEEAAATIREGGGQASYFHLDVTDEEGWETVVARVLEQHGHLVPRHGVRDSHCC